MNSKSTYCFLSAIVLGERRLSDTEFATVKVGYGLEAVIEADSFYQK